MSTDTHQINFGLVDIDGNLSNGLSSVSVKKDAPFSAKFSYLIHFLNDTDLVVDVHRAYTEDFFLWFVDSFFEELNIQNTVLLHW